MLQQPLTSGFLLSFYLETTISSQSSLNIFQIHFSRSTLYIFLPEYCKTSLDFMIHLQIYICLHFTFLYPFFLLLLPEHSQNSVWVVPMGSSRLHPKIQPYLWSLRQELYLKFGTQHKSSCLLYTSIKE